MSTCKDENISVLANFLGFLKKPRLDVENNKIWYVKLFDAVRLWALTFSIGLIFAFLSSFLLEIFVYDSEDFALNQLFEEISLFLIFVMVVVWAPISEELAFRLGLKFSPVRWGVGLAMFLFFMVSLLDPPFVVNLLDRLDPSLGFVISLSFVALLSFFFSLFFNISKVKKVTYDFFQRNFAIFFYTLALIFGLMHITNYTEDVSTLWLFAPILVMPQILLSFTASFIRVSYGFFWAVFVHALNNFVAIMMVILFYPLLEIEAEIGQVSEEELLANLSVMDFLSISMGVLFFLLAGAIVFFSIISVLLEFFREKAR